MIQFLSSLGTHTLALIFYPGLLTLMVFGALVEILWGRLASGQWSLDQLPRRRPTPVVATVALCSILAAVQLAAPFNPVPTEERSVVIAAMALAFTVWAELALTVEHVPEPGLMLIVQFCWLLAVLGPAVQPESLRPQVLGNVLVPGLLPVKVSSGLLYLLCLPALLRVWPLAPPADRRSKHRFDMTRAMSWFAYCGLFTTLFFPPSVEDVAGWLRFLAITLGVAALMVVAGLAMERRGPAIARGLYMRAVPPFALLVLLLVIATSLILR
ncbi:MAG: hypothetical protein ACREOM_04905 [Candidatus Dormibacteraceae bacterium]